MGNFRFYRRMRLFPGLSVNLSKSGPSLTVGMRGAHVTMGPRGVRRGYHSGAHSAHVETPISPEQQQRAHNVGGLLALAVIVGIALIIGIAIGSAGH